MKKIIWAVNPLPEEKETIRSAADCIRSLNVDLDEAWVEPVYVWSGMPVEFPVATDPEYFKKLARDAQDTLSQALEGTTIRGLKPVHMLEHPFGSLREKIVALISYAKVTKADLILLSSHGRKGLKRMVLGSFAETLVLHADLPFVVVHPNWKRTSTFRKILFPTDFTRESKSAFEKVLDFAAERKAQIMLFHKEKNDLYPMIYPTLPFYPYYTNEKQIYEKDWAIIQQEVAAMMARGQKRGILVEVTYDRDGRGSISESILHVAKETCDMIAMVSHTGHLGTVLMGSSTRQVVRYSEQPVWVIHPKPKVESKRKAKAA